MTELEVKTKPSRKWFYFWLLASLAWAGFIGWQRYLRWPNIPLDMSGLDSETQKIYTEALVRHVLSGALIGLGLPLLLYFSGKFIGKFRG